MTLKNSIFYYQIIFLLPFSRIINQTTVRSQSHSKMNVRYMKILLSSYFVEIIWTCAGDFWLFYDFFDLFFVKFWLFVIFLWLFSKVYDIYFLSDSPPLTCLVELYRCENDLDLNRSPGLKQMQCWINYSYQDIALHFHHDDIFTRSGHPVKHNIFTSLW